MRNCKFQRDRLRCGSFLHQIASILRRHSSHTSQKQVQKKTFEDKHFKIVGRAWFVADIPNVSYSTLLQLYLCSNMNSWKVYIRPAKNIIYLVFRATKILPSENLSISTKLRLVPMFLTLKLITTMYILSRKSVRLCFTNDCNDIWRFEWSSQNGRSYNTYTVRHRAASRKWNLILCYSKIKANKGDLDVLNWLIVIHKNSVRGIITTFYRNFKGCVTKID